MNLLSLLLPPAQAAAALAAPIGAARRRALAGVPPVALALASLELAGTANPSVSTSYFSITAGILLLGLSITLCVVIREWIGARAVTPAGIAAMASGAGIGIAAALPLLRRGGVAASLGATVVLGVAVAALLVLGHLLQPGRLFRWGDRVVFRGMADDPGARPLDQGGRRLLAGHLVCAALAVGVPHLLVLLPAVAATAILGALLERRLGRLRGFPWAVTLGLLALTAAAVLLIQVARGFPLSLGRLHDAPFSPAFEILVVLLLAGAAWPLLSLWPFHTTPRGAVTGVAGAALLFRLAAPALPGGLGHWQPALYLLVAVAAWYGAATGRDALMLTALGAVGLLSLRGAAGWAGLVLVAMAAVPQLPLRLSAPWWSMAVRTGIVAGAAMLLPILGAGLAAQAVYTVLVAAAAMAALGTATGLQDHRADSLEPPPAR